MTITDQMIDRSHRVGKPGRMGRDLLVQFIAYRYKHLIMKARSGLKNKDAARLGLSPAGVVRQPESAAAAAAMPVPSPAGRVYINDDLTAGRVYINDDLTAGRVYINDDLTAGRVYINDDLTAGRVYINDDLTAGRVYINDDLTAGRVYVNDDLTAGRVYINDDLTRERSRVAARARQLKRDKKIKDTWVRDVEIYVKNNDDYQQTVHKPPAGCVRLVNSLSD